MLNAKKKKLTFCASRHSSSFTFNRLSTIGTATEGFFFSPCIISPALSPYIRCMALWCIVCEVPPK